MGDVVSIIDYLRGVAAEAERVELEPRPITLDELNERYASAVLAIYRGNKTQAAKALGVSPATLRKILARADKRAS